MTGDPTGVETMEKKIETLNKKKIHLESGMNNFFFRFFVFFFKFKYNASCDEFWSRPRHPTFLLNRINLDPILAVFLASGEYPNRGFQIALF